MSDTLVRSQDVLRLGGGAFLIALGARTFLSRPPGAAAALDARGLASASSSTFVLTLSNPTTVLSFVAVFEGLGIARSGADPEAASMLVAGVLLGSGLWWLALGTAIGLERCHVHGARLGWLSRLSGRSSSPSTPGTRRGHPANGYDSVTWPSG